MRYQGKLVEWNVGKGFGFLIPNAGGRKIFVHANEFTNRNTLPDLAVGALLTFEVGLDAQKRSCAKNVATVIAPYVRRHAEERADAREVASTWSQWLAIVWFIIVSTLFALSMLPWKFFALWLGANIVTYMFYAIDKSAAKRGGWRTSESSLHLLALVGGWPAAAIAQQRLRHKTSKAEFRRVFWFTVIANVGAMLWLVSRGRELLGGF
jgi:uncharacterized membrane protein YsdA (DUF1294 family)/cold shock CspA family protein